MRSILKPDTFYTFDDYVIQKLVQLAKRGQCIRLGSVVRRSKQFDGRPHQHSICLHRFLTRILNQVGKQGCYRVECVVDTIESSISWCTCLENFFW